MSLQRPFASLAGCALAFSLLLTATATRAQTLPDLIKPPAGLNLGGTSFFDGFGRVDPGFVLIDYGRFDFFNKITDQYGGANPAFNNPEIQSQTNIFQFIYVSPFAIDAGSFGYTTLVPFTALEAQTHAPGIMLRANGFGLSDVTTGPFFQSKPIIRDGRPVFSYRAEFDVLVPVGAFNRNADINQSAGFYSINPYLAMTYLPTPKIEMSARVHYLYNYSTSRISNPPPIPGLTYGNGQAGQLAWVNFTTSYEVNEGVNLGLNGYYLHQFTQDRLNGMGLANSRQELLYLGPGMHVKLGVHDAINLNLYLPAYVRNAPQGPEFNAQYIHPF